VVAPVRLVRGGFARFGGREAVSSWSRPFRQGPVAASSCFNGGRRPVRGCGISAGPPVASSRFRRSASQHACGRDPFRVVRGGFALARWSASSPFWRDRFGRSGAFRPSVRRLIWQRPFLAVCADFVSFIHRRSVFLDPRPLSAICSGFASGRPSAGGPLHSDRSQPFLVVSRRPGGRRTTACAHGRPNPGREQPGSGPSRSSRGEQPHRGASRPSPGPVDHPPPPRSARVSPSRAGRAGADAAGLRPKWTTAGQGVAGAG
jgi:hypothetical protein